MQPTIAVDTDFATQINIATVEPENQARLVQLRFYAGLSNEEAARILGISGATAKRYWRYARAWLHREVGKGDDSGA